ncbi:hypothetical protein NECID01_1509 [Nematocida sp. AWRm77]|nr:hypothetical protein NECID01_1509 [Nematocida sp. AWRm77]
MNPFEDATKRTDRKTLQYFALVQKRDAATKNRALEKILTEIDTLDVSSVEQCLYDVLPALCHNAQESTQSLVSQLLGCLVERNSFRKIEKRVGTWLSLFFSAPDKAGKQTISKLFKKGCLENILGRYEEEASPKQYIQCKTIEAHYIGVPLLSKEKLQRLSGSSREELSAVCILLQKIEKKYGVQKSIKELVAETVLEKAEADLPQKWELYHLTHSKYTLENLEKGVKSIDPQTLATILSSAHFLSLFQANSVVQAEEEKEGTKGGTKEGTEEEKGGVQAERVEEEEEEKEEEEKEEKGQNACVPVGEEKDLDVDRERLKNFLEKCIAIPPCAFESLQRILPGKEDREFLLRKIAAENSKEDLASLPLKKEDFPFLNTINECAKITYVLEHVQRKESFAQPEVFVLLSTEETLKRAEALEVSAEKVAPGIWHTLTWKWVRERNLLPTCLKTLPKEFFEKESAHFTEDEWIYTASFHPSLCTTKLLDLLVKHSIFPGEILVSLSQDMFGYFIQELKKASPKMAKEVYRAIEEQREQGAEISTWVEFVLFSLMYTEPEFSSKEFAKQLVLQKEDTYSPHYLAYLVQHKGVCHTSLFQHIVEYAHRHAAGALDIMDECLFLENPVSEEGPTYTTHSLFVFGDTQERFKGVFKALETTEAKAFAQILFEALGTTRSVPDTALDLSIVEDLEYKWTLEGDGLLHRILRSMVFWKDLKSRKERGDKEGKEDKEDKGTDHSVLARAQEYCTTPTEHAMFALFVKTLYKECIPYSSIDALEEEVARTVEALAHRKTPSLSLFVYTTAKVLCYAFSSAASLSVHAKRMWGALLQVFAHTHGAVQSFCLLHMPEVGALVFSIDYTYLNSQALEHIQKHLEKNPEAAALAIKTDRFWEVSQYAHRAGLYRPVLKCIAVHYANAILNMYSMARIEEAAVDSEVFYMMFDIPAISNVKDMGMFEWRLFLSICTEIRSIEICTLVSTMVRAECKWLAFLLSCEKHNLELLGLFAQNFPVLVRIFYQRCKNKKQIREYIVSSLAPSMIKEEASKPLQGVDIRVKTVGGFHILVALYKIEESALEVNIHFPLDYPLTAPDVQIPACVGIRRQRLQRLLLRVKLLLSEFCKISEAMVLWKLALDESMNDVEECGICFFMIEDTSKLFPDEQCPSCSNKFHRICLSKWLKKSHNICPVCRAEITV